MQLVCILYYNWALIYFFFLWVDLWDMTISHCLHGLERVPVSLCLKIKLWMLFIKIKCFFHACIKLSSLVIMHSCPRTNRNMTHRIIFKLWKQKNNNWISQMCHHKQGTSWSFSSAFASWFFSYFFAIICQIWVKTIIYHIFSHTYLWKCHVVINEHFSSYKYNM